MYEIEKDLPPPEPKNTRYPFGQMEIGDSFLIPAGAVKNPGTLAGYANRQHAPKRFAGRKVDAGFRVWRIE